VQLAPRPDAIEPAAGAAVSHTSLAGIRAAYMLPRPLLLVPLLLLPLLLLLHVTGRLGGCFTCCQGADGAAAAAAAAAAGLNPAFQEEKFYVQHLREDERRVHRLFCDAAAAGIALQERSLSCLALQELVLCGRCTLPPTTSTPLLHAQRSCRACGCEPGMAIHPPCSWPRRSRLQVWVERTVAAIIATAVP
jgi:hypothetical protein